MCLFRPGFRRVACNLIEEDVVKIWLLRGLLFTRGL